MRALLFSLAIALGMVDSRAQAPELLPLVEAVDGLRGDLRLSGCGLAVVRDGDLLHLRMHGTLLADEVLPIASASKWLAVATLLTLVDEGKLDLDVPVARYVKEFDRPDRARVTLRQCLAHTSGLPARLGERLRGLDMDGFAAAAADASLRDNPGQAFLYGGVSFQLAAIAAERVTGQTWHELFAARIAVPLGMEDTRFGALQPLGGEAGTTTLPWVAGGAVSTLVDYTKFVQMLAAGGRVGNRQVLRAETVAGMWQDHVPARVDVRAVGFESDAVRYGLGTWLEPLPGGATRASDPGALGFTPWLDLDRGIGGVFAVRDRVNRVLPALRKVQDATRKVVESPLVTATAETVGLAHGGRDRRYHLQVPPHAATPAGRVGLPLVLVLHGGGGNGEQVRDTTGFAAVAEREGFVVVFPDGTGPLPKKLLTWNCGGGLPVYAVEHDVDDVGFLVAVVQDVMKRTAVDPQRIFAVGHSNGAMMCHRLAREAAEVFAGVAAVSGAMNFTAADATTPIAALLLHGTDDQHVRIQGGAPAAAVGRTGSRVDAPLQAAIDYYVARNGLRARPEVGVDGKVRTEAYTVRRDGQPGGVPVRVVTLEGGGHAWPGVAAPTRRADQPFPFDATREIWAFFAGVQKAAAAPAPVPAGR